MGQTAPDIYSTAAQMFKEALTNHPGLDSASLDLHNELKRQKFLHEVSVDSGIRVIFELKH
jgi:hypothetical protein